MRSSSLTLTNLLGSGPPEQIATGIGNGIPGNGTGDPGPRHLHEVETTGSRHGCTLLNPRGGVRWAAFVNNDTLGTVYKFPGGPGVVVGHGKAKAVAVRTKVGVPTSKVGWTKSPNHPDKLSSRALASPPRKSTSDRRLSCKDRSGNGTLASVVRARRIGSDRLGFLVRSHMGGSGCGRLKRRGRVCGLSRVLRRVRGGSGLRRTRCSRRLKCPATRGADDQESLHEGCAEALSKSPVEPRDRDD
jgi:hypothetical protein